jgi:hypothetical protein
LPVSATHGAVIPFWLEAFPEVREHNT